MGTFGVSEAGEAWRWRLTDSQSTMVPVTSDVSAARLQRGFTGSARWQRLLGPSSKGKSANRGGQFPEALSELSKEMSTLRETC